MTDGSAPGTGATADAASEELRSRLETLAIGHYVMGGLTALFGLFPVIHLWVGSQIITGKFGTLSSAPQEHAQNVQTMGWFFILIAAAIILLFEALAICMFVAGRSIKARRRREFCMVVAGLSCAFFPLGTLLGVFTLIVLTDAKARAEFRATPA